MVMRSLDEARGEVVAAITSLARPGAERVPIVEALGRTLAAPATADRDQPPFDRVTRDGFAVRAADVAGAGPATPARLEVVGEAPPGRLFAGAVAHGEAVEIMTGAPLPTGADAVVMIEYTVRDAAGAVLVQRPVAPGENVVPRGSELPRGQVALPAGHALDPASIGLLASLGYAEVGVHARPRVAILTTGDELVEVHQTPTAVQIRDSNRQSLAAQVARAGGVPVPGPIVRDDPATVRGAIERALGDADLLLLSGGVSMGKYDFVEGALAALGARVAFDSVAIRPGKPLVFGEVAGKPFFGLPGNPLSTLVTFELFVRPALALLAGAAAAPLRYTHAPLAAPYTQRRVPLTVFVPARLEGAGEGTTVRPLASQGSGDLAAMAAADALLVVGPEVTTLAAGAMVPVLPK